VKWPKQRHGSCQEINDLLIARQESGQDAELLIEASGAVTTALFERVYLFLLLA
jgi:hypothetical protein